MYTNTSYIFNSIFGECYDIFKGEKHFIFEKIETYRILWNFFVDYFIDDSFVFNFIVELRHIFGVYKQHDIVKFLHNLVLYRYNTFNVLENVKNILEQNLDLEIYMMKKKKLKK